MMPGATQLTLIPPPATSNPTERVNPMSAALTAPSSGATGYGTVPATEAMFTIAPFPRGSHVAKRRSGAVERAEHVHRDDRLELRIGEIDGDAHRAGGPTVLLDDPVHDLRRGVGVGYVELDGLRCAFPRLFPNFDGDGLGCVCSDIGDVDDRALAGEPSRDRRSDAGSGSGDQADLAVDSAYGYDNLDQM